MNLANSDYRNSPTPPVNGELNIRGARAIMQGHKADVAWVQPFISKWDGKWIRSFDYDRALYYLTWGGHHVLPTPVTGSDISGAYVIDFSISHVTDRFIALLKQLPAWRIHFDYATFSLAWEPSLSDVSEDKWMAWGFGWSRVWEAFPDSWLQTNKPMTAHPLYLEKVGWTLTPLEKAKRILDARRGCIVRMNDVSLANKDKVEGWLEQSDGYALTHKF